jgi:predicted XRE-type DNA-binding protein
MPLKKTRTFANVWDALEESPEDAATMTMRSNVMIAIKDQVRSWNTTQAQAARRLGITQPRLNDLLHGKINKFSRHADDLGDARRAQDQDRRSLGRLKLPNRADAGRPQASSGKAPAHLAPCTPGSADHAGKIAIRGC